MEEKLLTPDIARNVFNNGKEAPDFLRKRGTHIISTASVEAANAQRSAIANLLASKGSKCWSEALTYCPEGEKMMKNANKELLEGKRISGAEMSTVSADQAAEMVKKAERQIENNNRAIQMGKESYLAR